MFIRVRDSLNYVLPEASQKLFNTKTKWVKETELVVSKLAPKYWSTVMG